MFHLIMKQSVVIQHLSVVNTWKTIDSCDEGILVSQKKRNLCSSENGVSSVLCEKMFIFQLQTEFSRGSQIYGWCVRTCRMHAAISARKRVFLNKIVLCACVCTSTQTLHHSYGDVYESAERSVISYCTIENDNIKERIWATFYLKL